MEVVYLFRNLYVYLVSIYYRFIQMEYYVRAVNEAERNRMTYLPDIWGKYPDSDNGLRPMDDRDIAGRWSLGWRPGTFGSGKFLF